MLDSVLKVVSSVGGPITKFKPYAKQSAKFAKDPEGYLGKLTVASIIIKDGVGCWKYVTQSLNNDKIPEDKRRFVASLDATNGVLMILAQIGMFVAMRKYSGKIFDKIFQKSFNSKTQSHLISKARNIQDKIFEPVARKLNLTKAYGKLKGDGLGVFKFILDTAAATIVGKRIIVPFIATPLASKLEKWMGKKSNPNPSISGTDSNVKEAVPVTTTTPSITGSTNLLENFKKNN